MSELIINGKDAVAVLAVFDATGGAKLRMAAERTENMAVCAV